MISIWAFRNIRLSLSICRDLRLFSRRGIKSWDFVGSFHHCGNLEISEWWIKTWKTVEAILHRLFRLNLGELVVEGLGLFILVLKFGWKLVIFSKRGGNNRNNLFPKQDK